MNEFIELTPEVIEVLGKSSADDFVANQTWLTEHQITVRGLRLIVCKHCLDFNWVCEIHPDKPWAGIVGNVLGCEVDCGGPGMLCVTNHVEWLAEGSDE